MKKIRLSIISLVTLLCLLSSALYAGATAIDNTTKTAEPLILSETTEAVVENELTTDKVNETQVIDEAETLSPAITSIYESAAYLLETPKDIFYSVEEHGAYDVIAAYYITPETISTALRAMANNPDYMIEKYNCNTVEIYVQNDWRIDGGDWHYDDSWENYETQGMGFRVENDISGYSQIFNTSSPFHCELLGIGSDGHFDFDTQKLEMRCRLYVRLIPTINAEGDENSAKPIHITSKWSEIQEVSPKITPKVPKTFGAVVIKDCTTKFDKNNDNRPYLSFTTPFTSDIRSMALAVMAADNRELSLMAERRVGNGAWEKCSDLLTADPYSYVERRIYIPSAYISATEPIQYRLFYIYEASDNSPLTSFVTDYSESIAYEYTASPEETTAEPQVEPVPEKGNIGTVIICVVAAVAIMVVIVVVIVKKSRKNDDEDLVNKDKTDINEPNANKLDE